MKTSVFYPAAFAAAMCAATGAQAQTANNTDGNANANPDIATCAGCHGAKGEGNAASNFPRIAGQPANYLARQLRNYANGSRKNQVMEPIAKGLTPQQIDQAASYYAALSPPKAMTASDKNAQAIKRGEALATVGDDKLGVQGCANCHGPGGAGEPPTFPYLGGQHAGYLSTALTEWKSGARHTDPSMQMNLIAKRLSDADINALAAYYASQTPPAPATQRTNTAAGTQERPAVTSSGTAQRSGGSGSQAVGAEQGEPTSGGSQSIGGGGASTGSGSSGGSQSGPGSEKK